MPSGRRSCRCCRPQAQAARQAATPRRGPPASRSILWVLRTGARVEVISPINIPVRRPADGGSRPGKRRMCGSTSGGTFLGELDERGQVDWGRSFPGRHLAPAKKGARASAAHAKLKGRSCMVLVDDAGLPLVIHVAAANLAGSHPLRKPRSRKLPSRRAGPGRPRQKPQRIVADKAYDSAPLYERLRHRGIQLIAPHRRGRRESFQDGRSLQAVSTAVFIERTNSWLLSLRRLATRYEHRLKRYRAFAHARMPHDHVTLVLKPPLVSRRPT